MTSPAPKLLLTGATGFIGGSILSNLIESPPAGLKGAPIACLLRGQDRVTRLKAAYGDRVSCILYKDIDDLEATTSAASQHDIIINTTLGYHPASVEALVRGLAQRKKATGRETCIIHTSGTSNLGDRPISGLRKQQDVSGREFDDAKDDIYGFEKEIEAVELYSQRTAELRVIDLGLELGVKTLVIMSPTIYGRGTGLFNQMSIQVPAYIRAALEHGRAIAVGSGSGTWDHVHVEDLAELYQLVLNEVIENGGERLPAGKKGIIFSANGRHSWMDVSQIVADSCVAEGVFQDATVESVSLAEGTRLISTYLVGADELRIELGLCSNSRTVATVANGLGWKPTRGEEAWKEGIRTDVKIMMEQSK